MIEGVGGGVNADLAALLSAVENFGRRDRVDISGQDLILLRGAIGRLELEFAGMAASFAETDQYEDDGSSCPFEWIRHNCKVSGYLAGQSMTVGQRRPRLPHTVAALEAGEIGYGHLTLIAGLSEKVGTQVDETELVAQAKEMSVSRFRYVCEKARHMYEREVVEIEAADQVDQRSLRFVECQDGRIAIEAVLDNVGGALLRSALEPLARRSGSHDIRIRSRRLADALVELATHLMDSGSLPSTRRERTHVQITTSLETLLGLAGAAAADMEFALPITTRTVQRFACSGSVTRILLSGTSQVIDVGRKTRVVPAALSKAVIARDRHCQWPGCDRRPSFSEEHHLIPWAEGGPTDLDHLCLLCYRHHWMVHEGGWKVVRCDGGDLTTVPPQVLWGRRFNQLEQVLSA